MKAAPGGEVDKWRTRMVLLCGVHAVVGVLNLISGNVWDGIFDFLGAGIGYYGSRDRERMQPTMILCYVVFVIMDCFWACLSAMLLIAQVKQGEGAGWQKSMFEILTYITVFFYAGAIFVSYRLYKLLQRQFAMGDLEGGRVAGSYGGGVPSGYGGGGSFPAPGVVRPPTDQRLMERSGTGGSSSAFKGQGYRLGDGKRVG